MKRFAPFLFLLMLPVSAFAQAVSVVSGEHDGYTRLVFAISPDREWNLVVGKSSAKLVFPAQNLEFEDEGVFSRIPKTRLVSTHSEQGEAVAVYGMTLGCDCEVNAFPYLDAYIVVDIADAPETSITLPPARHFAPVLSAAVRSDGNDRPPEFVSWIPPRVPYYVSGPHRVNFPAQTDGVGLTQTQTPDAPPSTSHTDVVQVAPDQAIEEVREVDQELQEAVDAARNSLLQQLTLAADQGLLDLNGPIPEILQASETVHEVESKEPPEVFDELEGENQVLIQAVTTRDARAARGGAEPQNDHCPPPENLDIASWGSGEDFFDELSSARQSLLMEFDEPDFNEVERLVRIYLRYGFGAEARSYLLQSGQGIAQQPLFLDLAAIVDGQQIQAGGPLSQAVGCDGAAGLWALVGTYPDVEMPIGEEASIIEAFADLPPDVRRLLGPRLASAFLDRGFDVAARQISDILERAPGDHGTEHELVVGKLMQVEGSTPEAEDTYQALTEENSPVATDALIELGALGLSQDQPPPQHLLMDLGAAAKIWRGTPKGGELRQLEALWLAKLGREEDAIDLLVAEIHNDPTNADVFKQTGQEVLLALSMSENLANNYAEIVHTYIEYISEGEEADGLRLEIAAKLLLVGLPEYALEVLHPALQRDFLDVTLLAAKANIQAYRPSAALLLLNGIAGDAARKLRVEAYLGENDFEHALGQLDQFEDMLGAIVMPHWFKGNWVNIIKSDIAAAEIGERYFPDSLVTTYSPDELSSGDSLTLSAMRELLADSQSKSARLESVLLKQ